MTLRPDDQTLKDDVDACVRMLLPRRSLYILSGSARYDFTHSVEAKSTALESDEFGEFDDHVRGRRVSLIFRDIKR
jgi:alkylated DNA repair dioxygenase AlkB